jgi:glutamyl-tRNA reductase
MASLPDFNDCAEGGEVAPSRGRIFLVGMNHRTAPVSLRECIAFSEDESMDALTHFRRHPQVREVVLLSTCNRVEILLATDDLASAEAAAKSYLSQSKKMPVEQFEPALYTYKDDEAVRHVFRVAASLDSMMVGEPQILGQVKEAYLSATEQKTSGVLLNRLLHRAFFVAKRVRTETGIGDHAVSISYAAIELGRKIFGDLEGRKVLLLGAGEMAELAVEHLQHHQVGDVYVANRTFERGLELAQKYNGKAIHFAEIIDVLTHVDVIISSTGASEYVLTAKQVKGTLRGRRNRPLFFIDIAVPRDIDPAINRLPNVYLYDIDDLKAVVEENIEDRHREAIQAERIVEEAVVRFRQWYEDLEVVPTIVALRRKIESIVDQELARTEQALDPLSDDQREALGRMKAALVKKMLHDPTLYLKSSGCRRDRTLYLDVARKLFKLDD